MLESGRDGPVHGISDLQQYYLDARAADRQQIDNMKSVQGILEAVTQSTRFATAEIWLVLGNGANGKARPAAASVTGNMLALGAAGAIGGADAAAPSNKVAPADMEAGGGDLESGDAFGVYLKFSGHRATAASYLGNAVAGALGAKAVDTFEKLEQLYDGYQPHVGEGLQGEALERGDVDFQMLDDYVNNPERQVTEAEKLASSLYAASLAIPIRETEEAHSKIRALLVLYLPHEAAGPDAAAHVYVKSTALQYVAQTSRILSAELHKQDLLTEYHRLRLALKYTVKERAIQCWSRTRVTVKMGALSGKKKPPPPPSSTPWQRAQKWFKTYTNKLRGNKASPPPRADWVNTAWTFIGVFLGMLVPSLLNSQVLAANKSEYILMMGSFGALATLLYAAPASPFAQPRMVMLGHLVALIISIAVDYLVVNPLTGGGETAVANFSSTAFIPKWVAIALVPALAIAAMAKLGCINPPAAAASIIYLLGGAKVASRTRACLVRVNRRYLYVHMQAPTCGACHMVQACLID